MKPAPCICAGGWFFSSRGDLDLKKKIFVVVMFLVLLVVGVGWGQEMCIYAVGEECISSTEMCPIPTQAPEAQLTPTVAPTPAPTPKPTTQPTPTPKPTQEPTTSPTTTMKPTVATKPTTTPTPKPTQPPDGVAEELASRPGMVGRLTIADVGINVALFGRDLQDDNQAVVDALDSAAYIYTDVLGDVRDIISDHDNQGFNGLKRAVVGQTVATIDCGTSQKKYVCTEKYCHGQNVLTDLLADDGTSVLFQYCPGLIMYTCNADGSVTITCWTQL